MKINIIPATLFICVFAISFTPTLAQTSDLKNTELRTFSDSLSYAMATSYVSQFKEVIGDSAVAYLNPEKYYQGLKDAFANTSKIDEEGQRALQASFQKTIQRLKQAKSEGVSLENKKEGEDFLAANATKNGVKITSSGLQYKVLNEGTGKMPKASDKVKVHYEGRLIDGTVFDSSYERGEPSVFGVTEVISGWIEGLQLMKEGAKYQFYIPSNLAYGSRARGKDIGPYETLIFDLELIKIK